MLATRAALVNAIDPFVVRRAARLAPRRFAGPESPIPRGGPVTTPESLPAEALDLLVALLRFDTTNPPGNEGPCAAYIVEQLRAAGVEPVVVESEGRPNVVARLKGDGSGGGPLLLAGHMDVVPVERDRWRCDPFAAEVHDGYLYGRGAVDMKHFVAMSLATFLALARGGAKLKRDVIFAAVSDEEAGCTHGSRFLVEQHPDLVRAESMLGEFGGYPVDQMGVRYYLIQVGEKGVCQFRLTATGDPGHGSVPHGNNAVVKLGAALAKLGATRLPHHASAASEAFVRGMAAHQKGGPKLVLPQLLNPALKGFVLDRVLPDRSAANAMAAMFANTVSPTMLSAGSARNVIPGEASAVLDGRLIPGQTKEDLFREVESVIGPGFRYEPIVYAEGRENRDFATDPVFRAICDNVRATDPDGVPIPYLLTGFSDAQQFGRLGMSCWGYAPLRFPKGHDIRFQQLVHGHDERIHVEGFQWGAAAFARLVDTLARSA
jgi:acetylornithine deacetylase/succinyl-diaminopimelate desuccinylase-like protein